MTRSELYSHKADYEKMFAVLEEHKDLPKVDTAIMHIKQALEICAHFEKWHIDSQNATTNDVSIPGADVFCGKISRIPNQKGHQESSEVTFDPPRDLMKLWFSTGAYSIDEEYPKDLFDEMFAELQKECPPAYVDRSNNALYYTPDDAGKAFATCNALLAKYRKLYAEGAKSREIERLKKRLSELEHEGMSN